ncbi:hypothetical protein MMC11_004453 [Xylographa trunciseda]|nr:hypothetical protein [Xylographa trunciseda]
MTNESTSIFTFNPGNEAQPMSSPGTDHADHGISNGVGDFPFLADPSAIDWDIFMSDIDVFSGGASQTWPSANGAPEMIDTMKATTTATAFEHDTSPPTDPVPSPSITNTNSTTQINENKSTNSPMDAFDSHGTDETDCFGTVMDIIQSLHVPKPTCGVHQPSGTTQIPSVDVVLARNKQVLHTLEGMMYCSCSLDRQLGPLIGIAISKLLNWYAAAAKTDTFQSGSSPAAAFQPGSHEHASGLPITLGSYQMEGLDISTARILLVIREAEARIGPLLKLFERRFCIADGPEKAISKYSIPITRDEFVNFLYIKGEKGDHGLFRGQGYLNFR